jgi:hypothetical protein
VRSLIVLLAAFLTVPAYCLETALLSPAERAKRVPMTQFADFVNRRLPAQTLDFSLAVTESSPSYCLKGRDKEERPWRLCLRDAVHSGWRSAAKGTRTYYFTGYTGANGMGPLTWILALSFDDRGRPVPFFVYTPGGIEDVLDLDGTGPELLVQDYQGNRMDDPGYFVTTVYQQRGPYWYRSDGRHGEHAFRTSEKWSVATSREPAVLMNPPIFKWPPPALDNDPAGGIKAMITGAGEGIAVYINPNAGCREVQLGVLVRDSLAGRFIELEGFEESIKSLAKARASVLVAGIYRWRGGTECAASVLWASTDR